VPAKPYDALYSYKLFNSDRFDLLGNSLAILTGIASPHRAQTLVTYHAGAWRTGRGLTALFVSVYPTPACRLAAPIRTIQPARRVSQQGRLAVCPRLLCGGMRGGGTNGVG
jgi:hypothetical protein